MPMRRQLLRLHAELGPLVPASPLPTATPPPPASAVSLAAVTEAVGAARAVVAAVTGTTLLCHAAHCQHQPASPLAAVVASWLPGRGCRCE